MIEEVTSRRRLAPADLLQQLIKAGTYPFACWRMPGTNKIQLLISLQNPTLLHTGLCESAPGFIVNPFANNHPIKPTVISADILIREDGSFQTSKDIDENDLNTFLNSLTGQIPETTSPVSGKKSNKFLKNVGKSFEKSVERAVELIQNSDLDKVVLSRYEDIVLDPAFDLSAFFDRITKAYPNAFCNIWSLGNGIVWVGASPETLVSQDGEIFQTISLAGTQPLDHQSIQDISWRQKEIEEQALVSRYIINCFKKLRIREFNERGPKTVAAGSLAHLITTYTVNVEEIRFPELVDQMTELLHPTSAVCGMPIADAKEFIQSQEGYDREYYAGFIGPVNIDEKTHLFVNLRCMKFEESNARIYAGAGITEDSDPQQEFRETQLKMEILKSKLQV